MIRHIIQNFAHLFSSKSALPSNTGQSQSQIISQNHVSNQPVLVYESIITDLQQFANPARAKTSASFFKTAPGQYGHGDVFIGVSMPQLRTLTHLHYTNTVSKLSLPSFFALMDLFLSNEIHEQRMCGVLFLCERAHSHPQAVYEYYLSHISRINNWDLVDVSCPQIVGLRVIAVRDFSVLDRLARHNLLWARRIAIVSTLSCIRAGIYEPTFRLCTLLQVDSHDLIHKACGWMLREVGKRDKHALLAYLSEHHTRMPSIMLSYAMEHLPVGLRKTIRTQKRILLKKSSVTSSIH
jgi:3-methyladenine DNA glycosylase AlkD